MGVIIDLQSLRTKRSSDLVNSNPPCQPNGPKQRRDVRQWTDLGADGVLERRRAGTHSGELPSHSRETKGVAAEHGVSFFYSSFASFSTLPLASSHRFTLSLGADRSLTHTHTQQRRRFRTTTNKDLDSGRNSSKRDGLGSRGGCNLQSGRREKVRRNRSSSSEGGRSQEKKQKEAVETFLLRCEVGE